MWGRQANNSCGNFDANVGAWNPELVGVHAGRVVGVGPAGSRTGGPQSFALGTANHAAHRMLSRRKALLRHCLREQFQQAQAGPNVLTKLPEFVECLMLLAV